MGDFFKPILQVLGGLFAFVIFLRILLWYVGDSTVNGRFVWQKTLCRLEYTEVLNCKKHFPEGNPENQ